MVELYQEVLAFHTPQTWTGIQAEIHQVALASYSSEFKRVADKVQATLSVTVDRVERIENPFLWGMYLLKKQEYIARGISVNEMELFHCTAVGNIPSIIKNNLDWRKCSRTKFGKGVSFSPFAEYANLHANMSIGRKRATILTQVLCGNTYPGNEYMLIPPEGYYTSTGNGDSVYVKYTDHEFYPSYVAYYTLTDDDLSKIVRRRRSRRWWL